MLEFVSLTLRNFLSYGNNTTVLQLGQPGTTMVIGENVDDPEGQGANGVGKTVIINAIAYALYDKPVSDISKDNLVNNINKKNMEVTVDFKLRGNHYRIKRIRKSGKGGRENSVYLYENDVDITLDSVHNTNRKITRILGIPHELFVRIVVFSATHVPFLDLPVKSHYAANQTDIIEGLFDLTTLSEKGVILKEQMKETDQDLELQSSRINQLEREHLRHEQQLKAAKVRVKTWEQQNKQVIEGLEAKLSKISNVDFDKERDLHANLATTQKELTPLLEEQKTVEGEIGKFKQTKKQAEKDLVHLRDERCPYCLQQYKDSARKIEECEQVAKEALIAVAARDVTLAELDNRIEMLITKKRDLQKQIQFNDLEELIEIKNQSVTIQEKIEELKTLITPFVEPLEELEAIKLDEIGYDKINELNKLKEHQQFLLKLLTKKDSFVRKVLLNKNLPYLNGRLQLYLQELGLPHRVEFTHKLTAEISQFGRPLDFGNLSNGQRARVNLALSFAFRDVLTSLHVPVNICILDEVLDAALDTVGVRAASRLLKRKARDEKLSLYIISHRDDLNFGCDKTMTVQMSKGFSYIKEE